jgi:N-succinyl-L-ornithine transcarbamylase
MKYFTTVHDIKSVDNLVKEALHIKQNPYNFSELGRNKTIGLLFMNPSLRTRLSTQKAAMNLGMNVIVMSVNQDGWALELEDGAIMNGSSVEHIKDAAAVLGQYCDIIGIRCFPNLLNKQEDYGEKVLINLMKYANVPIVSLESATLHPLQSLADVITIKENWKSTQKPNVVLTWAPHIKPLPQAVANSFSEWICEIDANFTIAQPKGYELNERYTKGAIITNNQDEALQNADFVYVKNWSSYADYGQMPPVEENWLLTKEKLAITNNAKIMHCLPVRRNVELLDEFIDNENSLIQQQAGNRLYASQAVLKTMLEVHYPAIQKL